MSASETLKPLDKDYRQVTACSSAQEKFCTNEIRTSRYTLWNFLPLALMIQYTKVANISWTIVVILNSIKEIAVNSPVFIGSIMTIVLLIGITKEGITDYSRH